MFLLWVIKKNKEFWKKKRKEILRFHHQQLQKR
jgi:hypothetical protein